MQPRWKDPTQTPEGELLIIVKAIEANIMKGMCKNTMCKNIECMGCKEDKMDKYASEKGNYMDDTGMSVKNAYCKKNFNCDYSECTPEQKAQCDKKCGKLEKYDRESAMRRMAQNPKDMGERKPYEPYNPPKEKNPYPSKDTEREKDRAKPNPSPFMPKDKDDYDNPYVNKHEADRNKNGKLEDWEKAIDRKIKESKGEESASYKSDRGNRDLPNLKGGKGNKVKIDKTTEFLRSKGIMTKWEQEPDNQNSVPTFMAHSGGIPVEAINYHTNGTMPFFTEKAPSSSPISEKAKIPAFAKTSYDEKGSSLHMHLNDRGEHDNYNYRSTIEESMMQLKKAGGYGSPGLVEEIASQVELLMGRLS